MKIVAGGEGYVTPSAVATEGRRNSNTASRVFARRAYLPNPVQTSCIVKSLLLETAEAMWVQIEICNKLKRCVQLGKFGPHPTVDISLIVDSALFVQ